MDILGCIVSSLSEEVLDQRTERKLVRLRCLRTKGAKELDLTPIPVVEGLVGQVHQLLMVKGDNSLLGLILVIHNDALEGLPRHSRLSLHLSGSILLLLMPIDLLREKYAEFGYSALSCDVVRHLVIVLVLCLVVTLIV